MTNTDLGEFDGKPVRRVSLAVRGLGDGLSKAMRTDPQIIHSGERRFVVIEVEGDKVRHDPIDDGDAWERVHMTKARAATLMDETLVREAIDAQIAKNIELEEQEKGIQQIPPINREEEHAAGLHKRKRDDCTLCAEAKAAAEDELAQKRAERASRPAKATAANTKKRPAKKIAAKKKAQPRKRGRART